MPLQACDNSSNNTNNTSLSLYLGGKVPLAKKNFSLKREVFSSANFSSINSSSVSQQQPLSIFSDNLSNTYFIDLEATQTQQYEDLIINNNNINNTQKSFNYSLQIDQFEEEEEIPTTAKDTYDFSSICDSPFQATKSSLFKSKAEDFWNPKLDKKLLQWSHLLYNDWKKIAKKYYKELNLKVTPYFLKQRFLTLEQKAKGNDNSGNQIFTDEFDKKLVQAILKHGLKWSLITHELQFCDAVKLKNRYYNHIKKKGKYQQIVNEISMY